MNIDSNSPEKKIVVDEDWKSLVEAEREAARGAAEERPSPDAKEDSRGPTARGADDAGVLPPPNLSFLIGTLYIQGAMSLGLLVNPVTKKADVQLGRAKHAIDLLAMLQQKTEGNRTPNESEELETALYELRMSFVGVQQQ